MKDYLPFLDKSLWRSRECLQEARRSRLPKHYRKDINGYLLGQIIGILKSYTEIKVLITILDLVEYESYFYLNFTEIEGISKSSFKRGLTGLIKSGIVRKVSNKGIYQVMPAYVWIGHYERRDQLIIDWLLSGTKIKEEYRDER